ncbi:MAG: hypothetical protein ACOVOX_07470, partial [Burkholderiaceae bacterium]
MINATKGLARDQKTQGLWGSTWKCPASAKAHMEQTAGERARAPMVRIQMRIDVITGLPAVFLGM